jgi:hypothetical protein
VKDVRKARQASHPVPGGAIRRLWIPAVCRHFGGMPLLRLVLAVALAVTVVGPAAARAQQAPVVPAPSGVPAGTDTVRSRPAPLNYFFRSLLIPGWGQASLDRKLTGGMFIAFEGLALAMALKADHELGYLERTNSQRLEGKRQERQDWLVLVAVNHLFSGLEAYVSANLFDFPADLRMRALPDGRRGVGVTLPMPRP